MPVKIRCPECQAGLTLPDKARGRAVKCPECSGRVNVPAAGGGGSAKRSSGGGDQALPPRRKSAKRKKPAAAAASSGATGDDFLDELDLDGVEDHETRVCPACGQVVTEDDFTCPKCYVDIDTGRLSEEMKRKKARGAPDPDKYYERAFGDALDFAKSQGKLPVKTLIYGLITSMIASGCTLGLLFFSRIPLKAFFGAIGFITAMVPIGWTFCVHLSVIKSYFDRHNKKPYKPPRYDFFLCSALGFKFLFWVIAVGFPFWIGPLIGCVLMIQNDMAAAGLAVFCLGFVPLVPLFPISMSHYSMPIQTAGWQVWKVVPIFFSKVTKPALSWSMWFLLSMSPIILMLGVVAFVTGEDIVQFVEDLDHNARLGAIDNHEPENKKQTAGSGEADASGPKMDFTTPNMWEWWADTPAEDMDKYKESLANLADDVKAEKEIDFVLIAPLLGVGAVSLVYFAWASLFNMRTNAMFTRVFRPELELITQEQEVTFVRRKKKKKDEDDY